MIRRSAVEGWLLQCILIRRCKVPNPSFPPSRRRTWGGAGRGASRAFIERRSRRIQTSNLRRPITPSSRWEDKRRFLTRQLTPRPTPPPPPPPSPGSPPATLRAVAFYGFSGARKIENRLGRRQCAFDSLLKWLLQFLARARASAVMQVRSFGYTLASQLAAEFEHF